MHRRNVLQAGVGGALTTLAGCTGGSASSGSGNVSNETQGDGAKSVGGASASVSAFVDALEAQGVDVDSTMSVVGDTSLMYWHDASNHRRDIRVIADVFINYRSISEHRLMVTAIAPDGSRKGTFSVKVEWAADRKRGDISASTYHELVLTTWKPK